MVNQPVNQPGDLQGLPWGAGDVSWRGTWELCWQRAEIKATPAFSNVHFSAANSTPTCQPCCCSFSILCPLSIPCPFSIPCPLSISAHPTVPHPTALFYPLGYFSITHRAQASPAPGGFPYSSLVWDPWGCLGVHGGGWKRVVAVPGHTELPPAARGGRCQMCLSRKCKETKNRPPAPSSWSPHCQITVSSPSPGLEQSSSPQWRVKTVLIN